MAHIQTGCAQTFPYSYRQCVAFPNGMWVKTYDISNPAKHPGGDLDQFDLEHPTPHDYVYGNPDERDFLIMWNAK